mgnify:CR=1 FL=1
MSFAPHLTLISEALEILRRDFYLTDPTLLNPNNANPLLDGEWLELDSSYKMQRQQAGNEQAVPAWQIFAERGRYDTQAIQKTDFLFVKGYEAETDIADFTGMAVGNKLVVDNVTIGGLAKRGLKKAAGNGQHMIFAYVTRMVGSGATQKVRYWCPNCPVYFTI